MLQPMTEERDGDAETALMPTEESLETISDEAFDRLLPESAQRKSGWHWTPAEVARTAARLLVTHPGTRVLDIGCGPGKFCILGAAATDGHFTGVEQRRNLVAIANKLIRHHGLQRLEIIHANITEIACSDYDAFYLFNPFEENVIPEMKLDSTVELLPGLFDHYTKHVRAQLEFAPAGTRVVTYWCGDEEIPEGFELHLSRFDGNLRLWIKR